MPTAFITGASGQDGSYLTERLLDEGVEVHALQHAATSPSLDGRSWVDRVHWHHGDLVDSDGVRAVVADIAPDEIYNLAGVTSVAQSWQAPVLTAQVTAVGAVSIMQAAFEHTEKSGKPVRVLQPSSAEIFGSPDESPQRETTTIRPTSPYGAAKAYAHTMASVYRDRGLPVSTCILYNHESPRRPVSFVTRKITRAAAAISLGLAETVSLGNLDARRDWGWAPDYVEAMVAAARYEQGADFVIATGRSHSVREFVAAAFARAGVQDWESRVLVDPAFVRPADPSELVGDASKAAELLSWRPTVAFEDMVAAMVEADLVELHTAG
ncbi:MAG TPA: GDP-mannose 4,6-dehydratase [Jatrophihabitans sp.]